MFSKAASLLLPGPCLTDMRKGNTSHGHYLVTMSRMSARLMDTHAKPAISNCMQADMITNPMMQKDWLS